MAAVIAGHQAEHRPDRAADQDRDERHLERDPGAMDDPAQQVSPLLVGAE
jgi:hypothetical protein